MAMNVSAPGGDSAALLGVAPGTVRGRAATAPAAAAAGDRLGVLFPLFLLWLFLEFGRPPNPLFLPLLISIALFVGWAFSKDKQWSRQSPWFLVLLAVMAIGIPISENTFSAFWATRDMAVVFLCICLPMQALVNSVRRVRWWAFSFLGIATYVGAWAATHSGFGPSGAGGGQDENYVAALMGMAIPFAYFTIFATRRMALKVMLGVMIMIFVAAIALGANPSRGGFVGLVAVALYCLARSPRKLLGFGVFALIGVALVVIAGPAFWKEIGTSTDYGAGTADTRLEIWKAGMRMWAGNPIIGVGAGNFKWVLGDYQSAEQLAKFGRSLAGSIIAHSSHVEMVAELGTVGLVATAMLVWRTWTGLNKVRESGIRRPGQPAPSADLVLLRCLSDAVQAAIVAILVNGIFLSLFYYSHLWLLIAFGSAIPFVHRARTGGQVAASEPARLPRAAPAVASGRGAGPRGTPWVPRPRRGFRGLS